MTFPSTAKVDTAWRKFQATLLEGELTKLKAHPEYRESAKRLEALFLELSFLMLQAKTSSARAAIKVSLGHILDAAYALTELVS